MLQILCNEDSTIIPSNNNDTARSRCHNIKSNIISSKVDKEKITEWLASAGKTSEPKLLYRASRDGWSASDFHRMCDGKGATVTVVKSSDGYIFGGYTNVAWEEKGRYKSSAESFLFSLKDKAGIGPILWKRSCDLCVASNANANTCSYCNVGNAYQRPSNTTPTYFLTGSRHFTVSDYEVFLV
jgi:hypothetical protein